MGIELKLHPQTALLMLVDALMSAGANYKLELYVENAGVGGVIWLLNDDQQSGQFMFADSDLAKLLSKFMQFVQTEAGSNAEVQQQPSEPVVEGEPEATLGTTGVEEESAALDDAQHWADSTGVPE